MHVARRPRGSSLGDSNAARGPRRPGVAGAAGSARDQPGPQQRGAVIGDGLQVDAQRGRLVVVAPDPLPLGLGVDERLPPRRGRRATGDRLVERAGRPRARGRGRLRTLAGPRSTALGTCRARTSTRSSSRKREASTRAALADRRSRRPDARHLERGQRVDDLDLELDRPLVRDGRRRLAGLGGQQPRRTALEARVLEVGTSPTKTRRVRSGRCAYGSGTSGAAPRPSTRAVASSTALHAGARPTPARPRLPGAAARTSTASSAPGSTALSGQPGDRGRRASRRRGRSGRARAGRA